MTQIMTPDEIDALMKGLEEGSIDLEEIGTCTIPIYFYLRHKTTHVFSFFEVNKEFVEKNLGEVDETFDEDIESFWSINYDIISWSHKKNVVLDVIKERYYQYRENRKEPRFLIDFYNDFPEHLV